MYCAIFSLLLLISPTVTSESQALGSYVGSRPKQDSTHYTTASHDPDYSRRVRFGFKTGLNLSNLNFNKGFPKPTVPVELTWGIGFSGGFLMEVPIYQRLHFQQEYLYTYVEGKVESEGLQYKLKYISLPVLLKYKLLPRLSLVAGPQFDILLHAVEIQGGNSLDIIHQTEERNIGVVAGIEYKLSDKIVIDTRFMHGLNHIGMMQRKTGQEFKLESFSLSIILSPFN
ncbi:porin family protein [Pontibacter virosus]|uniref:Outer membrane protein with beta-barrel domain n=1 Tax=Pontibacter virosus TaxID=1765052 RepID=A0A2U1AQK1_9BACT|nr:porin family protein [Pontibacter virosus]PVY38665.1 outer membrane protein with beta-barrel domain [Pontibacter virosus]